VQLAHKVFKEFRDLLVPPVQPELREISVLLERLVLLEQLAHKELRVSA
jgi:hypothetical protein